MQLKKLFEQIYTISNFEENETAIFNEVYNLSHLEENKVQLNEVTIDKLMNVIHNDVGDGKNAHLRFNDLKGIVEIYQQGIKNNAEWYGKGNNGNPHYTTQEFRQILADTIANDYASLNDNDKYNLIQSVLVTWFGEDGTKEFSTEQIENFVDNYRREHQQN